MGFQQSRSDNASFSRAVLEALETRALMTATPDVGGVGQDHHVLSMVAAPAGPVAAASFSDLGSATFLFDGTPSQASAEDPIRYWRWQFGDGSEFFSFAGAPIKHVYEKSGRYSASLAVTTFSGKQSVVGLVVDVTTDGQPPFSRSEPFTFSPYSHSTVIHAYQFDRGGEGVAYHDTDAINHGGATRLDEGVDIKEIKRNQGLRVSDVREGEWLEYSIRVPKAGYYALDFRVSNTRKGGIFHAEFDGVDRSGPIMVPKTGSFNTFNTVGKIVHLEAGDQVMRLAMDKAVKDSVGSFSWISITQYANDQSSLLQPAGAAFVRDGSYANQNFGSPGELQIMNSSKGSRYTILKFDLSGITQQTLGSARLKLFAKLSNTSQESLRTDLFLSQTEDWDPNTVTWNNRPREVGGGVGEEIMQFRISGTAYGTVDLNLTHIINQKLAAGEKSLTLIFKNPKASGTRTIIAGLGAQGDDGTLRGPHLILASAEK